jgi:hypothetical protein
MIADASRGPRRFKDFKAGMEHLTRWERIAIVTDIDWIKYAIRLFSFLIPGAARLFPASEAAQAPARVAAAS